MSYPTKAAAYKATLKTESSNRYVLIDDFLCKELSRWQARQAENEKQSGYVYVYREENGHIVSQAKSLPPPAAEKVALVCTQNEGRKIFKNALTIMLRKEGLNARSFRHTHALIENGVPAKVVAGRLGHTNVQITQNIYTHNTLKMQEEAAANFAKTIQENVYCRQCADNTSNMPS